MRRLGKTVLTPLHFSIRSGHARSTFLGIAVSSAGDPLPWLTYPAIDFLSNVSWHGRSVLEFGGGQSTRWWLSRGALVTTLEGDPNWYASLRDTGADLRLVDERLESFPEDLRLRRFDVVVIDGLRRQAAARLAVDLVAEGGAIVFDNSEGCWSDDLKTYDVLETLDSAGFMRVDFCGYAPVTARKHCTSVHFKLRCWIFEHLPPPKPNG